MKAIDLRKLPRSASHADFLDHLKVGSHFHISHIHGRTGLQSIGIVTATEPGGPILADIPRLQALPTTGRVRISPAGTGISATTKPVRKGMPEIRHDRFVVVVEQFVSGLAAEIHGPVTGVIADSFKVGDEWVFYRERGRSSLTIHAH